MTNFHFWFPILRSYFALNPSDIYTYTYYSYLYSYYCLWFKKIKFEISPYAHNYTVCLLFAQILKIASNTSIAPFQLLNLLRAG